MKQLFLTVLLLCALLLFSGMSRCASSEDTDANTANSGDTSGLTHGLTEAQAKMPLAHVGDRVITAGELAARLAKEGRYRQPRFSSPERKREFLDGVVNFQLLAAEARRLGYDTNPQVLTTLNNAMVRAMKKERVEERVQASDITDEAIAAYYEAHTEEYHQPQQVRASQIVIRSRAKAERVLKEVLAEPSMSQFRALARAHNEDKATKRTFGDLRFFGREAPSAETDTEANTGTHTDTNPGPPREVREAAHALTNIGDTHPRLIQTSAGYHVVRLTGRRAALNRSLTDVERQIRIKLHNDRRRALLESIQTDIAGASEVTEHLDVLSAVRIPTPTTQAPSQLQNTPNPQSTP